MISLKTHNVLDYIAAALLVVSPYVFGFSHVPLARSVFVTLGIAYFVYSLLTDYYYCIARLFPIGFHMTLDVLLGLALLSAPSFFGYRMELNGFQYGLHIVLGLGAIVLVAATKQKTGRLSRMGREEIERGVPRKAA